MSKHSQRPDKAALVCTNCKAGNCGSCIDVLRAIYTDRMLCTCERQNHGGEPINQQVKDPETGSVYGPHSVIKEDGSVVTEEEFKAKWREQFGD